jgi:hypothetical protein
MAKEVGQALVDIISDGSSISRDEAGGESEEHEVSRPLSGRYLGVNVSSLRCEFI